MNRRRQDTDEAIMSVIAGGDQDRGSELYTSLMGVGVGWGV